MLTDTERMEWKQVLRYGGKTLDSSCDESAEKREVLETVSAHNLLTRAGLQRARFQKHPHIASEPTPKF